MRLSHSSDLIRSRQTQSYEVELFVTACMISSDVYVYLVWDHQRQSAFINRYCGSLYNTWYPVDADDVKTLKTLAGN